MIIVRFILLTVFVKNVWAFKCFKLKFYFKQRKGESCVCGNKCVFIMFIRASLRGRERNVLFNDTLNTFYLRLYGIRHMVKDHSDSEKGNPLPPHRLLLSINSKGSFICTIPQTG